MRDRLGISLESLDWRLLDAYKEKGLVDENGEIVTEKWDGTPNAIFAILEALVTKRRIAVESATGTGKTFLAAAITLWFLDVWGDPVNDHVGCLVLTVAPNDQQIRKLLWKEVHKLWPRFATHHPQAEILTTEIRMRPNRKNWGAIGWPVGVSAGEEAAVRAQGHHEKHMLVITDETPGMPNSIMEAFIGTSSAPHNIILALGNPDNIDDTLHELFVAPMTVGITVSAYDHPNIVLEDGNFIPGAVSQDSINERLAKYKDPEHPLVLSRIRGICPDVMMRSMFRPKAIAAAEKFIKTPYETIKFKLHGEYPEFRNSEGEIRFYTAADHKYTNRYIVFADTAGDSVGGDRHACVVYDRILRRPVCVIHMNGPRKEYITAILMVCERYRTQWKQMNGMMWPLFAWEKTGGSGSLIMDQRVEKYPNIYYGRSIDLPDANLKSAAGWETTGKSRPAMMNELDELGLDLMGNYPQRVVDAALLGEMRTFVYQKRGKGGRYEAAPGKFDDLVMCYAGALTIDTLIPAPLPQKETAAISGQMSQYEKLMAQSGNSFNQKGTSWDNARIPAGF